jgi:tetratricopeptide (TPR) repeat protein
MTEIGKKDKLLVKSPTAIARFEPSARKELILRGLKALADVRDADSYFFRGEDFKLLGKYYEAISNYDKALQIDPEHEHSVFGIGYCYYCIGSIQELKELIEYHDIKYYRENNPQIADHEYDLLKQKLLQMAAGEQLAITREPSETYYKKAEEAFKKLISIREKKDDIWWGDYASYYNLGLAQYYLDSFEDAIKNFERAVELNPGHENSFIMLGLAQYHLELYEEAIESFEQAIEMNPDDAASYYNLGLSQEELGIYHLALENFEAYLNLDGSQYQKIPECVRYAKRRIEQLKSSLTYTYFYNIAIEFGKKGQYQEALECYQRSIELNPSFADAYYNLALAQDALNLKDPALESFDTYMRLENHESPENREFITYANNRMKELREVLRKSQKKQE